MGDRSIDYPMFPVIFQDVRFKTGKRLIIRQFFPLLYRAAKALFNMCRTRLIVLDSFFRAMTFKKFSKKSLVGLAQFSTALLLPSDKIGVGGLSSLEITTSRANALISTNKMGKRNFRKKFQKMGKKLLCCIGWYHQAELKHVISGSAVQL